MQYRFQWDPLKARTNLEKHGVSFREAEGVFEDPMALTLFDEEHSLFEEHWITLGRKMGGQYLLVVHTADEYEDVIDVQIISARRATKREIRRYEEGEL
ncbi:BrnT family toxin [Synechococcus sp. PCC 7336]|uniref:BrnT family toxin n=1 Tax=Synechococcus sp. PCC 7336 TaxID=195250 RepID=UPI00035F6406|nr:BrnT family toxin [Synechococcus sp. PCC 7336]